MIRIFFGSSLGKVNYAKSHHCRIFVKGVRKSGSLGPHPSAALKMTIPNRVKTTMLYLLPNICFSNLNLSHITLHLHTTKLAVSLIQKLPNLNCLTWSYCKNVSGNSKYFSILILFFEIFEDIVWYIIWKNQRVYSRNSGQRSILARNGTFLL